jgi:tRNA 2-selenouridine synthase
MSLLQFSKMSPAVFLDLAKSIPVIDVRSPSEFTAGHIPGAINIPLFNDDERASVGTLYKKDGRIPAILEGLRLSGPSLAGKLQTALSAAREGKILVHCWRGGMRSEAMAWLFAQGGIETEILEGGYKSYRHHILESLGSRRKMIVLGGMTGSSKTHILRFLKQMGEQVIDLEGLANHKGSAFGSLGQEPQPSTEHFANMLFQEWNELDDKLPVWLEDESRNIGSVFMPENFYLNMQDTPAIVLMMDVNTRMPRLLREYSGFPASELSSSLLKISKRLGGGNTNIALNAVQSGDIKQAIEIALDYYDKAYLYGLKKKSEKNIVYIETATDDIETNALKIIEVSRKISW